MNEVGNEISHLLSLPLRGHVAYTVNCGKGKVVLIFDKIARELAISGPGSPLIFNLPSLILNPFASTESGNSSIGVSGIVKQTISVAHQNRIDPH